MTLHAGSQTLCRLNTSEAAVHLWLYSMFPQPAKLPFSAASLPISRVIAGKDGPCLPEPVTLILSTHNGSMQTPPSMERMI